MRNYSIKDTRWLNKGHEMDYIASLILRDNNEIYLVGAVEEIRQFYQRVGRHYHETKRIKGIVLTEEQSFGTGFDIPVIKDSDIPKGYNTIIVCTSLKREKYESIKQLFSGYGFEENKQFFQGELFSMVYEVYAMDKICIDRVEVFMTSRCSLKCEKCIAYIPYFKNSIIVPLNQLKEDADLLFSKVDLVRKYKVLGGEGLMYPNLEEYITYVAQKYRSKIDSFRIGTNGTIIPNKKILNICKEYNVTLDLSDYTPAIGKQCKLDEIKQICIDNGVDVDVKRTGEQWLDMGFPNRLPGEKDESHLREHFHKCAMFCRDFDDGKLYYCCSNFAAVKAGLFALNPDDYFDFRKDFTKKELLEYELGFSNLGYTTFCKVCRGCSDEVNPFHTEVARQII